MKILVTGHFDLCAEDLSGASELPGHVLRSLLDQSMEVQGPGPNSVALGGLARGISRRAQLTGTDVDLVLLPFGPASALIEALVAGGPARGSFYPIVVGRSDATSARLGSKLQELRHFQGTLIVEGGHGGPLDFGMGMLSALSGTPGLSIGDDPGVLSGALRRARLALEGRTIVFSASTPRPLMGPGGTAYLNPDVSLRAEVNPKALAVWKTLLDEAYALARARRTVGLADQAGGAAVSEPAMLYGSGAAGGSAALLAALGVPVWPTAHLLASVLDLPRQIEEADLVVALEPRLDAPNLTDSSLSFISSRALLTGTPIVAVGAQSSLSTPERADLGVHGVSLIRTSGNPKAGKFDPLEDVGRRVAQTWVRA